MQFLGSLRLFFLTKALCGFHKPCSAHYLFRRAKGVWTTNYVYRMTELVHVDAEVMGRRQCVVYSI
jgi:hypothetical protein